MDAEVAIQARGLAKHYGAVRAVDGIDLDVRRGEVYGFLGRNGAGKTTTIRMLLGLIRPSAGSVHILGEPLVPSGDVFARVGSLVETATAYPNLTVREELDMQRRLTHAPTGAVAEVIELLDLREYADRRAGRLSLGNRQRLALARALLHAPDVVVLDEPANGLDPAGIIEIRELLRRLADERGVTVFMSSHILAEVAHLADRIGIIHSGRMLEQLSRDELRARRRSYLALRVSDPDRARSLLLERFGVTRIEEHEGELQVFGAPHDAAPVARALIEAGLELGMLTSAEEDLEAYFIRLTGGRL